MGPRKMSAKWRCLPNRVSVIGDFIVIIYFKNGKCLEAPSSTPGGETYASAEFLVWNWIFDNFCLKHYAGR